MTFSCPNCGQHLSVETMYKGQVVKCPGCGQEMSVPDALAVPESGDGGLPDEVPSAKSGPPPSQDRAGTPGSMVSPDLTQVKNTLQPNIDRAAVTITEFMADKELEGGVSLDSTADSSASQVLTDERGRKYEMGDVVAQGGMGAIIDAKDANIRRHVAMKVMLNPRESKKEQVLRFIEEAQVTGQLEHPSIVPVHELGVDASGNVFYTMKLIKGRTLKDILKGIRDGDTKTIQDYPLTHLLTIYQKVCDAMAFAHSKHVIHRDLKPENIMVGEYGEVQVMDWGLAKVLPRKARKQLRKQPGFVPPGTTPRRTGDSGPSPAGIDSVRKDGGTDTLKTMDGVIMGTPGYMAPEQVTGGLVDARTDLFAVGVIAYEMLTGRNPFGATEGAAPTTVMFRVVHEPVPPLSNVDVADLDAATAAVIVTALQKDPVLRFATADDMRAALRGDLSSIPVQSAGYTPPVGAMPSPSMAAGEKAPGGLDMRVVWGGGAAVLVVAVALFMIFGTSTGGTVIITPPPPPATSTPPPPDTTQPNPSQTITGTDVSTEAQAVLDEYLAATRAQDIDRLMALYTDSVDPYRTHRRFPATKIRDERAAAFAKWPSTVMTAKGQPQITTSGESATVLYEKDWDFTNGSAYFRGAIMSRLKMRRIGGVMKIVGEEDIGAALWKASR
jgi:serine/threonine protein kinase